MNDREMIPQKWLPFHDMDFNQLRFSHGLFAKQIGQQEGTSPPQGQADSKAKYNKLHEIVYDKILYKIEILNTSFAQAYKFNHKHTHTDIHNQTHQ